MLYLVHHAAAIRSEIDPQRPLSADGQAHAERIAHGAAARGVKPAAIWHSGKLRARQTAEPFWRLCNPLAEFAAIRGLQPDDPPGWIRDAIAGETRDVMLVGHMPNLPRIFQLLTGRGEEFPLHGVVALARDAEGWKEEWRLTLHS
jgi:phosphohistidine phosphatase